MKCAYCGKKTTNTTNEYGDTCRIYVVCDTCAKIIADNGGIREHSTSEARINFCLNPFYKHEYLKLCKKGGFKPSADLRRYVLSRIRSQHLPDR